LPWNDCEFNSKKQVEKDGKKEKRERQEIEKVKLID
jgi:hypothetical protein